MFFPMPVVRKGALANNTYPSIKRKPKLLELKSILVLVIALAPHFKKQQSLQKEIHRQHMHGVTPEGGT